MSIANGGPCTDTFLYVDEQCSFRLELVGDQAQVMITGKSGDDCHLILTEGVIERLTPLFAAAAEKFQSLTDEELSSCATYEVVRVPG